MAEEYGKDLSVFDNWTFVYGKDLCVPATFTKIYGITGRLWIGFK